MNIKEITKHYTYLIMTKVEYEIAGERAYKTFEEKDVCLEEYLNEEFNQSIDQIIDADEEKELIKLKKLKTFLEEGIMLQDNEQLKEIKVMRKTKKIVKKIKEIKNEMHITIKTPNEFFVVDIAKNDEHKKEKIDIITKLIRDSFDEEAQILIREILPFKMKTKEIEKEIHKIYGVTVFQGVYEYVEKETLKKAYGELQQDDIMDMYEKFERN